MDEPNGPDKAERVIVWEKGDMVCTSQKLAPNHIVISLTIKGVTVEREVFSGKFAATDFAVRKMHAYDAF
jgi:hypothetical protein